MKTLRLFLIPFLMPAFAVMVVSFCLCPTEAKAAPVSHEIAFHNQHSCCCPEGEHCPTQTTIVEKDHAIGTESFTIGKVSPQAFLEFISQTKNFPIKSFSPEISSHSPPLEALQISTTVLRI